MDHIGIDVHKRESQIYILAEGGEVIERRIRTEPERFENRPAGCPGPGGGLPARGRDALEEPEPEDAPRSLPDGGSPPDQEGPHRVVSAGAGMLALTRGPNGSDVGEAAV
jgi:hypothetical protein